MGWESRYASLLRHDVQNGSDFTINNIDCEALLIDGVNILPKYEIENDAYQESRWAAKPCQIFFSFHNMGWCMVLYIHHTEKNAQLTSITKIM